MPDEEPPQPETIRSEIAPEGVTKKMTAGGGLWEPPTVEETAQLFPGYEVIGLLGRGGMGAVYQARQIELDRLVAIKLLPLEISADADFADRFRREARAMAKLNHPNIISVYDFGQTGAGHLYFVMEFVEGANLHAIIRAQELSADQALWLAGQVCTALAYAHAKGVVHRDIKPANVMVDTEGNAKVADFGLARLTDPAAEQLGHTQTGLVMGTPDYMAPEQMRGMNVDHRADIYSVGVMLYEMLCREVPRGIFSPPSVRTGCDGRVDSIVVKAMQSEPNRRYQSTAEMKAAVEAARVPAATTPAQPRTMTQPRAVTQPAAHAGTQSRPKSKTPLYAGIATALVIVIGAFIVAGRSKSKRTTVSPAGASAAPSITVAPKHAIDLLALIDPEKDRVAPGSMGGANVWEKSGGVLRYRTDGKGGKIVAPVSIAARSFEIEIAYRRLDGSGRLHVDLPFQGNIIPLIFDEGGKQPIHGRAGEKWPDAPDRDGRVVGRFDGRSKPAENDRITITSNGNVHTVWEGDAVPLAKAGEPHSEFPGQSLPSLFAMRNGYEIRAWTVRVFDGEAKVLRAAPGTTSPEPWKDWLVEAREKTFFPDLFAEDGSRVRVRRSGGLSWEYSLVARDMAVRATWKPVDLPPLIPQVNARIADGRYYAARVADEKVHLSERRQTAGTTSTRSIREWPLPAGFDAKAEHTLELRVEADLLTVRLNGEQIGSARDGALTKPGTGGAFTTEGTVIAKLEYLNLDAAPSAPVAAEKWQDLIKAGGWTAPWSIENGVLTRPAKTLARRQWTDEVRDGAWRVTRRWDAGWYDLQLGLRSSGGRGLRLHFDQASKPDVIRVLIGRDDGAKLGFAETKKRFQKGDIITVEFRAVGKEVTASIDDEVVVTVRDETPEAGHRDIWSNYGEPPAIHRVEFLNLDAAK